MYFWTLKWQENRLTDLFLLLPRPDSDIEEKRQNAIEQVWNIITLYCHWEANIVMIFTIRFVIFVICLSKKFFTKGTIVPSPWLSAETRKVPQFHTKSKVFHLWPVYPQLFFHIVLSLVSIWNDFFLPLYKVSIYSQVLIFLPFVLKGCVSEMIVEEPEKISGQSEVMLNNFFQFPVSFLF